ncbi:protein FAR1-RELATED SEQUENCE 3-like [Humulus lupulus]|uniref:protein FAR1-RELATED SEQUENCE 3-like n=1 Tax=Humulus lupulus TaxID=3486 RepID=UPI002B40F57F|nr:protein FAR1-RELATED SEQUENCE 3-like [Humulus lupulus]
MKVDYGVGVTYNKAWRVKELAVDDVRGSNEESYALLPSYLHMLKLANPGTITRIEKDEENRFKYMFLSFDASLDGWKHCRAIIVVDVTFLKTKCGGTLYVAYLKDGNNQIFLLAFGIGDSENDNAWIWFFRRLKEAIKDREHLCIVSDRHKSIKNAIEQVYPGLYHGVCLYHLKQNLWTKFRGLHVHAIFETASRAYSAQEYHSAMAKL